MTRKSKAGDGHGQLWLFARRQAVCTRCGRPLTSEESLQRGAGPVCAAHGEGKLQTPRAKRLLRRMPSQKKQKRHRVQVESW